MHPSQLILEAAKENSGMADVERLAQIFWAVYSTGVFGVDGDIVEFGCNSGGTSWLIAALLEEMDDHRALFLYDSFDGLPDVDPNETQCARRGDMRATKQQVLDRFQQRSLRVPTVVDRWFSEVRDADMPRRISFAYIDCDLYESTLDALELAYERLAPGGMILIDDYFDIEENPRSCPDFPGPKLACDEFFRHSSDKPIVLVGEGDLSMALVCRNDGRSSNGC